MMGSRIQPGSIYPTTPSTPWPSSALPESGQVSLELLFLPLEVLNIFHLRGGGMGSSRTQELFHPELEKPATLLTALPPAMVLDVWYLWPR